ncbi:hypothetical protein S40285_09551 [Stachybotrys chlorohalonatus IBT 40285]|uniref:Uncharacterized protein n=1 Tax=Stachybotrys chlorohalonatus (strain IBT 40285) TaxID=1283841 RepID=A0A084Q842_STAC4|nr:hypothetical protein S40285_09551 [Stachybotrys chlorohalonata IBT 40285]
MRLFLVRHGETVDNVAHVYAGSRDSALTAHGVVQARRLASHIVHRVAATHIFASNLQRAAKTAEIVRDAQKTVHGTDIPVVQLPELREKDFGSTEGVKFGEGKSQPLDSETQDAQKARVDRFIDDYLVPLISVDSSTCVVVAHGIILGILFRVLCARFPRGAVTAVPEAHRPGSSFVSPSWHNTGYVEATISTPLQTANGRLWWSWRMHIQRVNCIDHLKGLKKVRGVGSAAFDEKQKTMDSFFARAPKRRKHDA